MHAACALGLAASYALGLGAPCVSCARFLCAGPARCLRCSHLACAVHAACLSCARCLPTLCALPACTVRSSCLCCAQGLAFACALCVMLAQCECSACTLCMLPSEACTSDRVPMGAGSTHGTLSHSIKFGRG